jgi:AraC-like DNA-binding protein
MNLQEKHQTFQAVLKTADRAFDYYKIFSQPGFSCARNVQLLELGYRDAARGKVASDYLYNSSRPRNEAPRWAILQYVLKGEMRFFNQGEESVVKQGEAALFAIPSQTSYHDPEDPDAEWFYISFCGTVALAVVDEVVAKTGNIITNLAHSQLVPMAAQLFSMALAHATPHVFEFSANLYRILMELASGVLSYHKNYPEPIAHALDMIDHQFSDSSLSLDKLAAKVGLSKYYFSRMFKDHVGESPAKYLQEKRMQVAMDLLLRTDQPLKEIQYFCGFSSYSYFLTVFRNFFGISPGAIRS